MYKASIISISIFLVIVPFLQLPELNLYDTKRILQLGLFIIIGLILIASRFVNIDSFSGPNLIHARKYFSNKKNIIAAVIFVFSGLISMVLSNYPSYAFLEISFMLLMVTLIAIISPANLKQHYFFGKVIFLTAVIYTGLYIIVFFGNYIISFIDPMVLLWPNKYDFSILYDGVEYHGKEILYFVNIRFFNHTQTWTLPILIGLLTFLQKKNWDISIRAILFFFISFWWMLLIASAGRGAMFGIIVSLFFLLVLLRKEVLSFINNGILTLCSGSIFYFLIFVLPYDGVGQTILRTESSRPFRIGGAIELWADNPLFGVGPMHYAEIGESQMVAHPHNFYLQILSEWGIIAFITFSYLLVMGLLFIYKNYFKTKKNSLNRILFITLSWSLLSALIHAFFSGIMHTPISQIWLILILAWFFAYKKRPLFKKNNSQNIHVNEYIYFAFLIIVMLLTYDDIISLNELYQKYIEAFEGYNLYPRFWGQGFIPESF